MVHIQLLYGILYTTTSRPNTNTSTTTLHAELLFIWTACDIPKIAKRADFFFGMYQLETRFARINMTQATTTAVLETQQMHKILHH